MDADSESPMTCLICGDAIEDDDCQRLGEPDEDLWAHKECMESLEEKR